MSTVSKPADLTAGPIAPALIRLALPLLFGNILQQLYNTVDAVIVGRWAGSDAFAAVGVAGTLMNLFLFLLGGVCAGVAVIFSQQYGARDFAGFRRELFLSCTFGGLFSLALSLLALLLAAPLLALIQTPAELVPLCLDYLRVIFGGLLTCFAYNLSSSSLRSAGDTLAALLALGVSILANVGLDLLFVAKFQWGVAGAAWATVASQTLAAILAAGYLAWRYPELLFRRADCVLDRGLLGRTVRFAAASALHHCNLYLGKMLVQGAVNTLGTPGINAYTAASRIEGFANSFGDSGAAALSVFVGQNTGAGRPDRVRKGYFDAVKLLAGLGVGMAVLMFVGAEFFSKLLLPAGAQWELSFSYSVDYLRTISLFYILCFTGNSFAGYFQGVGRLNIPVLGATSHITMRVILSWLLAQRLGLRAVALATGLGWIWVNCFWSLVFRGKILKQAAPGT